MKTKNLKHYYPFLEKVYNDLFESRYSGLIKVIKNEDKSELVEKIKKSINAVNKSLIIKNKKDQINYLFEELYIKKRNYLEVCNEISSRYNIGVIDVINFHTNFINYFKVHCAPSIDESFEKLAEKNSIKLKPKTKRKLISLEPLILNKSRKTYN